MSLKDFQWPLRVYIEDTDAGGIVYYVNYLKYMERARTEMLRSLGYDKQAIFNDNLMFVVRDVHCEYRRPARLDDELLATARVVESSRTSLRLEQRVLRAVVSESADGNEELLCRAEVQLACVERQSLRPRRIPPAMLSALT